MFDDVGGVLVAADADWDEVEEMLVEGRALVTRLRQMFPEVWPTDAILLEE